MLASQGTTYFDPAPLVTIRVNPVAFSTIFIPDYKLLLDSKEQIVVLNALCGIPITEVARNNDMSSKEVVQVLKKFFDSV